MKTPEKVAAEAIMVKKNLHGMPFVFMGEFGLNSFVNPKAVQIFADFARCELAKIIAADRLERGDK